MTYNRAGMDMEKLLNIIKDFANDGKGNIRAIKPVAFGFLADAIYEAMSEANTNAVLDNGWRDARKEMPVTPFLAYWTDGRITVLEEGDSVAYAVTGDREKRVIGWIPLSEIGKPPFT
jgi:hypothetical protein